MPTREERVNTEARVQIQVRPVVSTFAAAVEDSFVDGDGKQEFIGAWTGDEKSSEFVEVAANEIDYVCAMAHEESSLADRRDAIIKAGAYLAMALMCIDEEIERHVP